MTFGLAALLGIVLHAIYAGAPVALVAADQTILEAAHTTAADRALRWIKEEETQLIIARIGCILSQVFGAVTILAAFSHLTSGLVVAILAGYAIFLVAFGEILPKVVGRHHATALAPYAACSIELGWWLFLPFLLVWLGIARIVSRLGGPETPMTREEILLQLQDPTDPQQLDPEDHKMIQRVFAITEKNVFECMTPLVDVDAIPVTASVREAIRVALRHGHTRLPVYEERIDRIVGIVYTQDLLFGNDREKQVNSIKRPVKYVPDSKRVDELLHDMRRDREHFAVVVDEYGGSIGIVTIEDLLEELIGDIADERETEAAEIRRLSDNEWRISARVDRESFETATNLHLPVGEFETVAGFILAKLGRIPAKGEEFTLGDISFRVEDGDARAIRVLIVQRTNS